MPKENVLQSLVIIVPSPFLLSAPYPFVMDSNNRTRLEETTDPAPHGDQRLHVQQ
jgi:hypothetical protein